MTTKAEARELNRQGNFFTAFSDIAPSATKKDMRKKHRCLARQHSQKSTPFNTFLGSMIYGHPSKRNERDLNDFGPSLSSFNPEMRPARLLRSLSSSLTDLSTSG